LLSKVSVDDYKIENKALEGVSDNSGGRGVFLCY